MQVANANPEIKVTGRHVAVTDAIVDYARKKVESLHLDYPRIIDAQVILDVEKYRHIAEVVLHCNNHITIDASAETPDLYASIDEAVGKIAQQMRKHKTKIMRQHRPRRAQVRHIEEQVLADDVDGDIESGAEPMVIRTEKYPVKPMFVDEAVLQLQMNTSQQFVVFLNAKTEKVNVLYRRKHGNFGVIEPVFN
ncbi:MAG TPA: ribosome-associated translation inhibitor RaiA [Chthoniobacteraceae bacterium]|jgi:putative sigma-54 modulation protein|nr:ribosome-associated translation inhibitor RaiA [Chthoniobacteraceae bacterium]